MNHGRNTNKQSRRWLFTVNNYMTVEVPVSLLDACEFVCLSEEVGAGGTPHLQGYLFTHAKRTLMGIKRFCEADWPSIHLEAARGTHRQNIDYCKGFVEKKGDRLNPTYFQFGVHPLEPGDVMRERFVIARQLARLDRVEEIEPELHVRYYSTWNRIRDAYLPPPLVLSELRSVLITGPAGCGKTRRVWEEYPGIYIKMHNKWWDGYDRGPCLMDDVDPTTFEHLGHMLKLWCDRYPLRAEMKGKCTMIRPDFIVMTSQYTLDELCTDSKGIFNRNLFEAMNRRIEIIYMV